MICCDVASNGDLYIGGLGSPRAVFRPHRGGRGDPTSRPPHGRNRCRSAPEFTVSPVLTEIARRRVRAPGSRCPWRRGSASPGRAADRRRRSASLLETLPAPRRRRSRRASPVGRKGYPATATESPKPIRPRDVTNRGLDRSRCPGLPSRGTAAAPPAEGSTALGAADDDPQRRPSAPRATGAPPEFENDGGTLLTSAPLDFPRP